MRFRGFRIGIVRDAGDFIAKEIGPCLKDLFVGLNSLDLVDNFNSFEANLELANGEELTIKNRLKHIPSKKIITRQTGNGLIVDGAIGWNSETLSLKNHGPDRVTITVIFMR